MTRLAALALVCLLAACGRPSPTPQTAFDGRVADWTREILAESPELATRAGVDESVAGAGFERRLDDRSPEADERRRTAALRRVAELRAIDARELTGEEAITHASLSAQFAAAAEGAAFSFGGFTQLGGATPYAFNQLDGAYLELPDFFETRHGVETIADA